MGVCVLTSEEKWDKLKDILEKWWRELSRGAEELDHKALSVDRGFLVYVTRNYPAMVPYLKGFHLTIEMWRGGRDAEGWKLGPNAQEEADDASVVGEDDASVVDATRAGAHGLNLDLAAQYLPAKAEDEDTAAMDHVLSRRQEGERIYEPASGMTPIVPRLIADVAALRKLTASQKPPLRVVRPSSTVQVFYGFGDASGKQFGSTVSRNYNCQSKLSNERTSPEGLRYRVGIWTAEEEEESSNYKELSNLVEMMVEEAEAGRVRGAEMFLFTDNLVSEGCFYRGSSKSKKLHNLILRLRQLEMDYGMVIHLIHVAGTRMIAQGTDGCSRGSFLDGVMAGDDMLAFVDLAKGATERSSTLVDWIRAWTGRPELEPLTPEGWFEEGHGITGGEKDKHGVWIPSHEKGGNLHLWPPPPAAADAALEELLKARHKRTDTFHVVAIPRLASPRWRRLFNKVCDFTFAVPAGTSFWPSHMHEPLWVGIVLPFIRHRPWCLKRAPLLVELGRDLRGMLKTSEAAAGDLLCKLLLLPRRADSLSEVLACGLLHVPRHGPISHAYRQGRSGKSMAQGGGAEGKVELRTQGSACLPPFSM